MAPLTSCEEKTLFTLKTTAKIMFQSLVLSRPVFASNETVGPVVV